MKKGLAKKVVLALIVGTFVMSSCVAVTYASDENTYSGPFDNDVEIYGDKYSEDFSPENINNKTVNIISCMFKGNAKIYGGWSSSGEANSNMINITHSTFRGAAAIYGGMSEYSGNAKDNTVNITASTFGDAAAIYGGMSEYSGNVKDNTVNITASTFGDAATIYGGRGTSTANASGNTVTITGGTFGAGTQIFGGFCFIGEANGNTVNITDGTFGADTIVFGGYSLGTANGNTVNISGTADLSKVSLSSGRIGGVGYNNTLNIGTDTQGWQNSRIKSIHGFDTINFNKLAWENGGTAVETAFLSLASNGTTVKVNSIAQGTTPQKGESMTLIAAEKDFDKSLVKGTGKVAITSFVEAKGEIIAENNKIDLLITGAGGNEQALVIGESRTAATAFTNQGSELIKLTLDALHRDETIDETKVFAAAYGNVSKYETGSHVKVNGWSGIVGVGKTTDNGLTYGAFFENGEGNYRTYNNVNGTFVRGDGEANYNGGGLLVRKENRNGIYTEASLRAGNLSNRLDGAVMGSEGLTGYDIDTFYYGAHVGIGKIIPKGEDSLDVYGKFIYTHHDSEDFVIDGDEFHFDSMDSQRLRLGFRYNSAQTKKLGLYYGAAWEYEFGGDANNTVVGYDLTTPSLEGSTVIGELGMHYLVNPRWSLDLNFRGYAGQRDGYSGSVHANYRF